MRIVWHSNAPWATTAYGQQTALFAPLIQGLGHHVTISAFNGLSEAPLKWNGITVLPGAVKGDEYGAGMLAEHVRQEQADVGITLGDIWVFSPAAIADLPAAHWMPVDCTPLSVLDARCLELSGARPIAMSRFGETQLRDAGFDPLYVPHGLHPAYLGDLPDRDMVREQFGVTGRFAVGINAANKDAFRKGIPEQFLAFARLHQRHPDTVLMIHGRVAEHGSLDLAALAETCGITAAVRFVDQYPYITGQIPVEHLVAWYTALDLYSGCSFAEGFGIPLIEAQACGVPVVVTDAASMGELAGAGWKVKAEPFYNPTHRAWWAKPLIGEIDRVYERAYQRGEAYRSRQARARRFAQRFEASRVAHDYWKPALEALEAGL